jgi:hypothetical protein
MPRPEYDIHLDEQEANTVLQGLGELPAKVGYNLITKVAQVIATTNKAWQEANPQGQPPLAQAVQSMTVEPGPQVQ